MHFSRSRGRAATQAGSNSGSEPKRQRASSRDAVASSSYAKSVGSKAVVSGKKDTAPALSSRAEAGSSSQLQPAQQAVAAAASPRAIEARQAEEKDFIRQHDTPEAQLWFLVDVRWLTEWKQFVTAKGPLPGPIDNSRLLDRQTGRPRSGLRPVDDYRGVNSSIWNFWHSRYGGGPVVRRKQLDIYSSEAEDPSQSSASKRNDIPLPGSASAIATSAATDTPTSASSSRLGSLRVPPPADMHQDAMSSSSSSSLQRSAALAAASSQEATSSKRGGSATGPTSSSRGQSVPAKSSSRRTQPSVDDVSSRKALCCDKCDGPHETDDCPHFRKAREKHADAWSSYGKAKSIKGSSCENVPIVKNARVVPQPADGSCLFHSLSYGLADHRANASTLRRDICGFIAKNPDLTISDTSIKDWVQYDSNQSVASYAAKMSGGVWGGGIEMAALTKLKGVSVHVYEKVPDGYRRISAFENPNASKTISVLYQGRMHYDALVL